MVLSTKFQVIAKYLVNGTKYSGLIPKYLVCVLDRIFEAKMIHGAFWDHPPNTLERDKGGS